MTILYDPAPLLPRRPNPEQGYNYPNQDVYDAAYNSYILLSLDQVWGLRC